MAELKIGRMMMGVCQTNCYFIYEEGRSEVIFVDPADKGGYIYDALAERGFTVAGILLTHGHFDHIWGVEELREKSGAKVYAYEGERELLGDAGMNVSAQAGRACTVDADIYVKDGGEITIAGMTCRLIATPGHTGGSCCYYFAESGFLISGDTLFAESVGRTDFPTGSMSEIVRSIKEKLFVLPDETKVYPGHGGATTIAHEKEYNPFCG
ncbi:MAG: MBL fold metallo-hydrolase [Lachnospiraceae bacterium]|nr:MBL fold metallo-hydrolase [Lachnospiraceae bacterium]